MASNEHRVNQADHQGQPDHRGPRHQAVDPRFLCAGQVTMTETLWRKESWWRRRTAVGVVGAWWRWPMKSYVAISAPVADRCRPLPGVPSLQGASVQEVQDRRTGDGLHAGKPAGWWRSKFLAAIAPGCSGRQAAAGITETTPYHHRQRDPQFGAAWAEARAEAERLD